MNKLKNVLLVAIVFILSSCAMNSDVIAYWVNSTKADCEGVAPMACLLIQKSDTITSDGWVNFHSPIAGFDYEAGYIYQIQVKAQQLSSDEVAADASSIQYTLVKVLSKEVDSKLRLNDIWVVASILGEEVVRADNALQKDMTLELHLKDMRVVGSDGCNNFMGSIISVDQSALKIGALAGTRMMCPDMTLPDLFGKALGEVHSYDIDGLKLNLYDEHGDALLELKKVD